MPLVKSSKPGAIGTNIREFHAGKKYAHTAGKFGKQRADKQAIAVALSTARKAKQRADGGMVPYQPPMLPPPTFLGGLGANQTPAFGGSPGVVGPTPSPTVPSPVMYPPRAMKNGGALNRAFGGLTSTHAPRSFGVPMTRGPILSAVPGRTDAHATHVPSGAYVIPADIVSGHGEGNTIAGAHALQNMFKMGPHSAYPHIPHSPGAPKFMHAAMPKSTPSFKAPPMPTGLRSGGGKGGDEAHMGSPVRVNLAGGEIVVPPENLKRVVHPDLKRAHAIMDVWVKHERRKLRKTLAKLPPPARD